MDNNTVYILDEMSRIENMKLPPPHARQSPHVDRFSRGTVKLEVVCKFVVDKIKLQVEVPCIETLLDLSDHILEKVFRLDCCAPFRDSPFDRSSLVFTDSRGTVVSPHSTPSGLCDLTLGISFPMSIYFGMFRYSLI